jgi:hypothetical protein
MKETTTGTIGRRIVVSEGEAHKFEDDGSVTITKEDSLLPLRQDAGS